MEKRLILFVVEGGMTRTHAIPMDETMTITDGAIREGWDKMAVPIVCHDFLTGFVQQFVARKRAVRFN